MKCPGCDGELKGSGSHYKCTDCGQKWRITFRCEVCGELPKVAAGCGSVSFFCDTCNNLKSRESMDKEFVKDTE